MQKEHEVTFLIADYHANDISMKSFAEIRRSFDKIRVNNWITQSATNVLPLFYQLAHSTPVAELARLPQYTTKEQTLHMLSYPLLMAADIIVSDADAVIVGDDQEPHMHFYREIARRN